MKKEIRVRTSKGWYTYKVEHSGRTFYCYERGSWSDNKVGEARSLEDAVSLIKSDARKYGVVQDLSM